MKVKDLIEKLQEHDPEMEVYTGMETRDEWPYYSSPQLFIDEFHTIGTCRYSCNDENHKFKALRIEAANEPETEKLI
jgi:hypothetical protein